MMKYNSRKTSTCVLWTAVVIGFFAAFSLAFAPPLRRVQSATRKTWFVSENASSNAAQRLWMGPKSGASKPNQKNNTNKNKSKWARRRGGGGGGGRGKNKKGDSFRIHYRDPPKPRPLLNDYDDNKNTRTNQVRLTSPINCQHFGSCPGCVVNERVGEVAIIQSAKQYFSSTAVRRNRLDVQRSGEDSVVEANDDGFYRVVVPSEITQWRTQAKLVAAPKSSSWAKDGCKLGLYERGTHDVLDIPECKVHHPSINRAVAALEKATDKVGTPAYSEDSREGGLRYVQFQVERTTGKISLTLVWAAPELKFTQPALSRLTKELTRLEPTLWHSMWCHCNDGPGNNIFTRNPRNWHRLSGNEFIREPLSAGDYGWLYFSPLTFRQGNMEGFDIIANDVARAIPAGARVCELYAGVGLLGLTSLVFHGQQPGGDPLTWIRCSDENPANLRSFTRSLNSLPKNIANHGDNEAKKENDNLTLGDLMKMMEAGTEPDSNDRTGPRASYLVASAADALQKGQALGAEILVVDPPRKGLEDEVLDELCKPFNKKQPCVESANAMTIPDEFVNWTNDVQTLIYVSCGFDALARDCERLLTSRGGWMLESATGYVLFPGSNHVETVCVFQRT